MSPFPQRALRAGDRLRELVPDSGHLVHMPTHIDVLCGNYNDVMRWNQKAVAADRKFVEREGVMNFYTLYRVHNHHFVIYGAMFLGQYTPAIEAAQELIDTMPEALLRIPSPPMADFLEPFLSMKQHVLIRFGKWREIIAQELPEDRDLYCSTTAMMLYAKGVAHSVLGEIAEAEKAREAFRAAKARVPDTRLVHNNTVEDLLDVAAEMLSGELEYRRGNVDTGFAHLRRAVELSDALPYDEPWGWMQPPRHALGALLLEQGQLAEAEAVYRSDLGYDGKLARAYQHPDNVWSLHGLHECLTRRGDTAEAPLIKARLELAQARTEVPIRASCLCRREAARPSLTEGVRDSHVHVVALPPYGGGSARDDGGLHRPAVRESISPCGHESISDKANGGRLMDVGMMMVFASYGWDNCSDDRVWDEEIRLARLAADLGFDCLWSAEHHFNDYSFVPDNLAADDASRRRSAPNIDVGTAAVILPWHDPLRVAENAAVLDMLSKGRLRLGMGRGLARREFAAFRLSMDESRGRFDEAAPMIVNALKTGFMEGDGKYYKQPRIEIRPRPQHSFDGRIYAVASSEDSVDSAAKLGAHIVMFADRPWEMRAAADRAWPRRCIASTTAPSRPRSC